MLKETKTEVLVVGAGPVGLLAATLLAENGVQVQIIDQEERTATRSYACALHPRTLQLLDRLGLLQAASQAGRRIDVVAFYDGSSRRAELQLSKLPVPFPFVLVLPQSAFEHLLERRLAATRLAQLHWHHRLSSLQTQGDTVLASVDKLVESSKGYVVATWQGTVEKTLHTRASFVVGADGCGSVVRQALSLKYEKLSEPDSFAIFEADLDADAGHEVRVVLDKTTNVLWPLPGNQCRWTLQYHDPHEWHGFPAKDRMAWRFLDPIADQQTRERLEKLIQQRAPWFKDRITDVEWSPEAQFVRRLAQMFGQGRCWLAGDAAHQTAPVGMQSMNLGLLEAEELAAKVTGLLRSQVPAEALEIYGRSRYSQWRRLLGLEGGLRPNPNTDPWLKTQAARLLSCLPASGEDLQHLARQLGFEFVS